MNINQAYSIFELSSSASDEDIKKKYKELSKKLHPDRNKEKNAEQKFKDVNAAYDILKNRNKQNSFSDFFQGGFSYQQVINYENIEIETKISFKDSVLGCKKDISYERDVCCKSCNGAGQSAVNNGCTQCHGSGIQTSREGNAIFRQLCSKCQGIRKTENCKKCDASGKLKTETKLQVNIPAGILNKANLRLEGMGNFVSNFMMMQNMTDVILKVSVEDYHDLRIENLDVVSVLKLEFKEAIHGCEMSVKTIDGDKKIKIPRLSKNKEEVIIEKLGVARKGNHRVILNIEYPSNILEIVKEA